MFGRAGGASDGIDISKPAPGGLIKWLRTSEGGWVGVVNVMIAMTDGSAVKYSEQLVPASALSPR